MDPKPPGRPARRLKLALAAVLTVLSFPVVALAEDADSATAPASTTDPVVQKLIKRIDAQDAVIADLKAKLDERNASAPAAAAPATGPAAGSTDSVNKRLDSQDDAIKELRQKQDDAAAALNNAAAAAETFPTVQFHVFGDIDYHTNNLKTDHNAFTLGEFDVFVSAQIAPDLGVLTETVFAADNTNEFGVEFERLMVQWHPSEYFNVDVGRYHTAVGYYNTAYHHGTWFQTATGRPLPLNFEDSGGVIPVHSVGFSIHGAIPGCDKCPLLESLGLSYFAEVGNGRQYQIPTSEQSPVANVFDNNDYKATNIGFTSRPEAIPGLQFGAGFYHDTLTQAGLPKTDEVMIHGHIVYKNADWEILSEGYAIRHQPRGTPDAWSSIGFVQVAKKFGAITPYGRFTYFNGADSDPVYQYIGQPGRHFGPAVGVRYDFSTYLALKVQYDYVINTGPGFDLGPTFNQVAPGSYSQLSLQAAFTY